jgi:hypothetical protein
VEVSASDLDNIVALMRIKFFYPLWICLILLVADSQLSIIVVPPCENVVLVIYVEGSVSSAEDISCVLCSDLDEGLRSPFSLPDAQHSPKFPELAVTLGEDLPAG